MSTPQTQAEAISAIYELAERFQVRVTTLTVADVIAAVQGGIADSGYPEPTPEQVAAVVNSREWNHWGENENIITEIADHFSGVLDARV